ncbi:MAG: cytochrome c3 family protein [Candidatus Latescibacterota bacterium]|nr:MAG: cytochrome c3 family protein [Candidatus Latescibacterota bacterium]
MKKERSSKSKLVPHFDWARRIGQIYTPPVFLVLLAVLSTTLIVVSVVAQVSSPHLDPVHGVHRISSPAAPIGSCGQCHAMQQSETGDTPVEKVLFTENSNNLCFTADGESPCHKLMPIGYPADESSRIPDGFPDAGYFEYNTGGVKVPGVEYRNRWTGQTLYDNPAVIGYHFISPHGNDPDMPKTDTEGRGSCLNCHDPHESANPFDLLVSPYRGVGGFDESTYPKRYQLCFDCHSHSGPMGMESENRLIQDFYDSSINNDGYAGHQIRKNPRVAISWPSFVQVGDKLPCYNCHNPHGSQGYNALGPNAFLISDERPGWENLTDTLADPLQNRRFCLGCHIDADGIPGSITVNGIVMNTLSNIPAHGTGSFESCGNCHGADYSSSTSYNVHHPLGSGIE